MSETLWYSNGLRFECTQCGRCCGGAPGFVWVNQEEIATLAAARGETEEAFEERYVRTVGVRKCLREFPNYDCIFFDSASRGCIVYAVRPRQCRTWPFWDSNVRTPESWERTCQSCPGSGKGPLYRLEDIERCRQVIKL